MIDPMEQSLKVSIQITSNEKRQEQPYKQINGTDVQLDHHVVLNASQFPRVPQSKEPEQLYCSNCQNVVQSVISHQMGKGSYMVAIVLLIGIITAILALIPFFFKDCQDVRHTCPKCKQLIGTKQYLIG